MNCEACAGRGRGVPRGGEDRHDEDAPNGEPEVVAGCGGHGVGGVAIGSVGKLRPILALRLGVDDNGFDR